ncbi:MAG: hypothetical protein AB7Q97_00950 [Gammaproteobacteria bacterium]
MRVSTVAAAAAAIALVFGTGVAWGRQGHMESALMHLKQARHQLQIARHDKEGHRRKAIALVDDAIAQVQAGIAAGAD